MYRIQIFIVVIFASIVAVFLFIVKLLGRFVKFIHHKKRYAIPFYAFIAYAFTVFILVKVSGDPHYVKVLDNKRVNDITQLNAIQVGQIIQPHTVEDISQAIKSTDGKISIGGGRFSMGGQIGYENSLHFDMRQFNKVLSLDTVKKQVTVQAGIVWRDLQKVIDKHNLAIKIMQTYANFTVGGSISVNCHGRYIGHGPIISSVVSIKLILADGKVIIANRQQNVELFKAAIGGYGGIGVIAEATLQLVDNTKVERETELVEVADYRAFFNEEILSDSTVIFQNGDLYPPNYETINNVVWKVSTKELTDTTRVTPEDVNYWLEPQLVNMVSWGSFGKWVRRNLIDPAYYSKEKVVWRNKEASYDVAELEPASREKTTYVLQEYFIPVGNIESFIPKMRAVYEKYNVNVINVSLRHAFADKESYLSWADEDVFAFVIYYKQGTDDEAKDDVARWTVEMTDAIISEKGKWYLPYQPHATLTQFNKAFPKAEEYFKIKNSVDSLHRFTNKFLDKYNPYISTDLAKKRKDIKGYFRDEGQTVLTVPEWYLVFNPNEYADYLESGANPSNFPFYASIDEYWTLYDRSQHLVSEAYANNDEYNTMLQVIGVSVTMEYAAKLIYENTIGRLFSWFYNGTMSDEEKVIVQAQRAYADFIYHTAWYEFEFLPWVKKVYTTNNQENSNWLRKWERMLFFTVEFSFKAAYAQLIDWAASATYEEPVNDIFMVVNTESQIADARVRVMEEDDSRKIVAIKRWGEFTKTLLDLNSDELSILEISGNDQIAVSVITKSGDLLSFKNEEWLYNSKVVTDSEQTRILYLVPVKELLPFIRFVKQDNNASIEHIYDF